MFRYSHISALTHDSVTEAWSSLPRELHPVLLGSGELALAVDGTGMQGLGSRRQQFRDTASLAGSTALSIDAMYLYRDEALSEHYDPARLHPIFPGANGAFSLMPCGWMDYIVEADGECYDAARVAAEARDWSRTFSPRSGLLTTAFSLGALRLELTAGIAPDAVELDYRMVGTWTDGRPRPLAVTVRCHLALREGRPLATGGVTVEADGEMVFRRWQASSETSSARLLHPITLAWALIAKGPASYTVDGEVIAARMESFAATCVFDVRLVAGSDRDGTHTREHARARAAALRNGSAHAAIAAAWQAFHEQGTELWIGDPTLEYLTFMQQYVMRAGSPWHSGMPLGMLWNRAFAGATFWDSFFASDGMLRSGHTAEVRAFCDWLVRSSPAEGRPHFWMTWYDGTPCSTGDQAYQVCLSYAQVCVRLYEFSRDPADLRERVFPYLRRVAAYLLTDVLVCKEGQWQLQGEVAGDIDAPAVAVAKEPGMLAWVVVCIAKCGDYARLLGEDDALARQCQAVDAYFRAHPIELSAPGMWAFWHGYLTGMGPHQDEESYRRHMVEKQLAARFDELSFQPWGPFGFAANQAMLGQPDLALMQLPEGLSMVHGIGYISETPLDSGGGITCYPPACGSYLSALTTFMAWGSLWDDEVKVGVALPRLWRLKPLRFRGVATLNGARVSGTYAPTACDYEIVCGRPMSLRALLPRRVVGEPLRVTHNGVRIADPRRDGDYLLLPLVAGGNRVTVDRDLAAPSDVLVVEPFSVGVEVAAFIAAAGLPVRLLREYDAAPRFMAEARMILLQVSFATPPDDLVDALTAAARRGAAVVTLYHAACLPVAPELAELTGVRAKIAGNFWDEPSRLRTHEMTAAGRRLLPDLPVTMTVPSSLDVVADLADDVEVLAVEAGSETPALTRRRLGDGWLYWYAPGGNMMDRDFGKIGTWQSMPRITRLHGQDVEAAWSNPKWARSEGFQQTVLAIAKAHLG